MNAEDLHREQEEQIAHIAGLLEVPRLPLQNTRRVSMQPMSAFLKRPAPIQ